MIVMHIQARLSIVIWYPRLTSCAFPLTAVDPPSLRTSHAIEEMPWMENAAAGFANLALNAGSMTFRMVLVAMVAAAMVAAAHANSASEATLA